MYEVRQKEYVTNSEKGVSLERLGRYRYVYRHMERLLILFNESGEAVSGGYAINIQFPKSMRWEFPYNGEPIEKEEAEKIKSNIREALAVLVPDAQIAFFEG